MAVLDPAGDSPDIGIGIGIGIVVADLESMSRFYEGVLGLVRVAERRYDSGTQMIVLRCGSTRIKLNRPAPPPSAKSPQGAHRDASGIRYLTFTVADAERAHAELADAGAELDAAVRTSPAGRLFFARDPEGNNIEILQPGR